MKELATAVAAPSRCGQTVIITSHARATIFYSGTISGIRSGRVEGAAGWQEQVGKNLRLLYAPPQLQVHTEFTLLVNFFRAAPASAGSAFCGPEGKTSHGGHAFCELSVLPPVVHAGQQVAGQKVHKKRDLRVNCCPLAHKKRFLRWQGQHGKSSPKA